MTQPTQPIVPPAPLRSEPSTFNGRLEASLSFWTPFAAYMDEIGTYTKEQADAALAAASVGDLPALTGETLNFLRVKADESGLEFRTPAEVASEIESLITFPPGVPAGGVLWFAADAAPTGYLKANGAAISRTTYSDLFAVIGTTFGAGDGGTTFLVPDLRGEFVRGWDDSRGVDSGRGFGSAQGDDNKSHRHSTTKDGTASTNSTFQSQIGLTEYSSVDGGYESAFARGISDATEADASTSSTSGGNEARPRNIALLACIKY